MNVSARSLEDIELGSWILQRLKDDRVDPRRLGLEITETTAIGSLDDAVGLATRLTGAGCGFALDDFGAGFGSFSYLKNLPFTAVKIAGEFVAQVDADPVDAAFVTGSWASPDSSGCGSWPNRSTGRSWSSGCAPSASTTGGASTWAGRGRCRSWWCDGPELVVRRATLWAARSDPSTLSVS